MSLTVTQRPYQTINSKDAKWNAVGNPVIYKMQRKDFTFNQVNNNGGFIQLQFNSTNLTASLQVGDTIYIQSDNGIYDLYAEITASSFSTNTLVTVDASYVSAAPGGFINNDDLRALYKVEVEVYNADDELINDSPFVYSPDRKGVIIINISAILRSQLSADNEMVIGTDLIFDNTNAYIGFYIKYTEIWVSSAESQTSDIANQYYSVMSARQIRSPYGGNMYEYILGFLTTYYDSTDGANWSNQASGVDWTFGSGGVIMHTDIVSPASGSKRARRAFSISNGDFIRFTFDYLVATGDSSSVGIYLGGSQLLSFGSLLVGSGTATGTITALADFTYFEFQVNTIEAECEFDMVTLTIEKTNNTAKFLTKFDSPSLWRGWPCLIGCIINESITDDAYVVMSANSDAAIPPTVIVPAGQLTNIDLNETLLYQDVNSTGLKIVVEPGSSNAVISENIIKVKDPCRNPIMLLAMNTLGGPISWLFDVVQEYTFDYGNDVKNKRLVLYADGLSINEWESLQDFITLGEVYRNNIVEFTSDMIKSHTRIGQQVYVVDQDGSKTGVIVIPTSNQTKTNRYSHDFEIEIEFPEVFTA